MQALPERIEAKIEPEPMSGCWIWTGARHPNGYGHFAVKRRAVNAHRVVYELLRGPIPVGLELDHLCRLRCCVNPAHLEAVEHKVNVLRGNGLAGLESRRTHCPQGHSYDAENTRHYSGRRFCRACNKLRWLR